MVTCIQQPKHQKLQSAPACASSNPDSKGKELPEYAVMILIIQCLKLHKENLSIRADQLKANADLQNYWEKEIQGIHNIIPDADADNKTITRDQAINQAKGNERANDEDILITTRQQAHILMTDASTETNEVQQASAIVSFVLKTYLSEGKVIVDMTSRNS